MTHTPFTEDQKKRVYLGGACAFVAGGLLAFLITSLVLNKKYARLEAQYWGM